MKYSEIYFIYHIFKLCNINKSEDAATIKNDALRKIPRHH